MLRYFLSLLFLTLFFFSGCDTKEVDTTGPLVSAEKVEIPKRKTENESTDTILLPDTEPIIEPVNVPSVEHSKLTEKPNSNISDAAYEANEATQKEVAKKLEKTSEDLAKRLNKTAEEGQKRLTKASSKMASTFDQSITPPKAAGCAVCHGKNGEKEAIGKSKIINQMSEEEFVDALIGYKEGTYGGAMKGMMTGQVKSLTKEEMKELAKHFTSNN